jgi:hypothetical protein
VLASASLVLAGLGATPATSAPDSECPAAFPVAEIADGQAVEGLTVSKGTTPEGFTGEVLGVLDDGIAPGFDMIIARLHSPEIDRVGGIWEGMSGSPVYAADGRLVGAVSYGLSFGASPVAGITPAEEMYRLVSTPPAAAQPGATSLRAGQGTGKVAIPRSLQREIVASGRTSSTEAGSGMARLPVPLGISGMVTGKRLNRAAKALDVDNVRVYKSGAVTDGTEPAAPIVPGGNLAGSISYGDLSAIGIGTATAVCGDEVIGFGHPFMFSGPSTLSMHGASAIYVQEDPTFPPYKVANAGAAVGGITQDRMAGILGVEGAPPPTTSVTSDVSVPGRSPRTGTTKTSVDEEVPFIAAFHLLVDQDRVFDGISGGSAEVGWTVTGQRADGSEFSYSRDDRFANQYDITFAPVFPLYFQLSRLQNRAHQDVTITDIHTRSLINRDYQSYRLQRVEIRSGGAWSPLRRNRMLVLKAGTTKQFRVTLTSAQLPQTTVRLAIPVPARAGGKGGYLRFLGGRSAGGAGSAKSLDELLEKFANAPRNDEVLGRLHFFGPGNGALDKSARPQAQDAVVSGRTTVPVVVVRRR